MSSSARFARGLAFGLFALLSAAVPALSAAPEAGATAPASHPPGYYGYGTTPTPAQIAGWAIAVRPDGQGLPPGHGDVTTGGNVFQVVCASCHGTFGEGVGRYPKLANGGKLTGARPDPTVGNYWPYATTLYDFINRAMPFPTPHRLPPDQVYAIVAYILNLNNIVPANFVADRDSLPKVKMPNRHGFIWKDPRPDTHDTDCMTNCRKPEDVKIVSSAEGKHLTPRTTGSLDTSLPQ